MCAVVRPLLANYPRNGTLAYSGFAVDLGPPPADANEQEAPVAEEFGRLALKGMADELEDPSDHEEPQRDEPKAMIGEAGKEHADRNQNRGNAVGMADAIDRVLVAPRVLGDPLIAGAIAEHAAEIILRIQARLASQILAKACHERNAAR